MHFGIRDTEMSVRNGCRVYSVFAEYKPVVFRNSPFI